MMSNWPCRSQTWAMYSLTIALKFMASVCSSERRHEIYPVMKDYLELLPLDLLVYQRSVSFNNSTTTEH